MSASLKAQLPGELKIKSALHTWLHEVFFKVITHDSLYCLNGFGYFTLGLNST